MGIAAAAAVALGPGRLTLRPAVLPDEMDRRGGEPGFERDIRRARLCHEDTRSRHVSRSMQRSKTVSSRSSVRRGGSAWPSRETARARSPASSRTHRACPGDERHQVLKLQVSLHPRPHLAGQGEVLDRLRPLPAPSRRPISTAAARSFSITSMLSTSASSSASAFIFSRASSKSTRSRIARWSVPVERSASKTWAASRSRRATRTSK